MGIMPLKRASSESQSLTWLEWLVDHEGQPFRVEQAICTSATVKLYSFPLGLAGNEISGSGDVRSTPPRNKLKSPS